MKATDSTGLLRTWTEKSARDQLVSLNALWLGTGYTLSPTLNQYFLQQNLGPHDLSASWGSAISRDVLYRSTLTKHVRDISETYSTGQYKVSGKFKVEWLYVGSFVALEPFAYISSGDLNYAIGTGWFSYKDATLDVKVMVDHGAVTTEATLTTDRMRMDDNFAYWQDFKREIFESYDAGVYLQTKLHYDSVKWFVEFPEAIRAVKIRGLPIPR